MKTYLLLSLHHSLTTSIPAEGWKFESDGGGLWVHESDPEQFLLPEEIHEMYDGEYSRCEERPVLVGSKEGLTAYAKNFAYRYPEGTLIVEIPALIESPIVQGVA